MATSFETIMEKKIPEINFLSASGANIRPGSVLESLDKDIEYGYLPKYIKDHDLFKDKKFEVIEEPYDILVKDISGELEFDAAANFMKIVGLKFDGRKKYKINFEINEIRAKRFKEDITPLDLELALNYLRKNNKKVFKKFKNHFLVIKVLYANKYSVTVEVKKGGSFEADVNVPSVNVEAGASFKKKENTLIVSQNSTVPFGVIGYKIKARKLKEVD
jgi:hypothetical protein